MRSRRCSWLLLWLAACGSATPGLDHGVMLLPAELAEVSGIVALDARTLACVQDEAGIVFMVDLAGERPMRAVAFGPEGDYEGIAFTGSDLWVLRSDGALLRLAGRDGELAVAATFRLPKGPEYEGLCHDASGRRLLALTKGPPSDKKRDRHRLAVIAFDLDQQLVLTEPVLTVDRDLVSALAVARGLPLPMRSTKKGEPRVDLELAGSELLTVTGSGDLLLLSSPDRLLLRVDPRGEVVTTRLLPADQLPQPEAMAWLPDGRLVVASESRDGPAAVLVVPLP